MNPAMTYLLAFHLIAVVCWFAGLFYLPRLFVYHAMTPHETVKEQLKVMEHKLYYYIMMPSMLLTLLSGLIVMLFGYLNTTPAPTHLNWLWIKLALILILVVYHFYCGHCVDEFKHDKTPHSHTTFRLLNEVPTVLLIVIVVLAVVRPF